MREREGGTLKFFGRKLKYTRTRVNGCASARRVEINYRSGMPRRRRHSTGCKLLHSQCGSLPASRLPQHGPEILLLAPVTPPSLPPSRPLGIKHSISPFAELQPTGGWGERTRREGGRVDRTGERENCKSSFTARTSSTLSAR